MGCGCRVGWLPVSAPRSRVVYPEELPITEHWFDLVREQLRLDWLARSSATVPFGLTGVPADQWTADELETVGTGHWRLTAHTPSGLEATWDAVFFADTRAVECWGTVRHRGRDPVRGIRECLTLDLVLPASPDFRQPWLRTVNGVRFVPTSFPPHDFAVVDRQLVETPQVWSPLTITGLDDGRTSGENLPCAIVTDDRQQHGLALFLEWSGLWRISINQREADWAQYATGMDLVVQVGLRGLNLDLQPGQSLPLPRVLLAAFDGDLEAGGNALRRHVRRHVTPKLAGREVLPPVSFNHWFAFGNEFTADLLKPAVDACAAAGLEYFCVDAAWFAGGFRRGIGNWDLVDPAKFPEGIRAFADYVRARGMQYGTWFEPEWAHLDSQLYRAHPDWFWATPASSPYQQPGNAFAPEFHLMNFGLRAVQQWWVDRIRRAYDEWGVRWIRWDFNQMPRPNWDHGVPDGQLGWRQIEHVTGLYRTLDAILAACPELFLEQCAGGGHRIDLGTVRRGHSFWMNDHTSHTDIVRALQHGLNTVLPGNYANTNLCQCRHDFTEYDFLSHSAGGFGYSGRLWEAPRTDFERYRAAVERFKSLRPLLLGDYHRPTGQPRRADQYARVEFADAGQTLVFEFNPPGHPREAWGRGAESG